MQFKYAFFGNSDDSEARALVFIDKHWDRVISFGHSSTMDEMATFEQPGYYVRYGKDSVTPQSAKVGRKASESAGTGTARGR